MDVIAIYNASTPTKYPQVAKMVKNQTKLIKSTRVHCDSKHVRLMTWKNPKKHCFDQYNHDKW
jgi:hypothetical protein